MAAAAELGDSGSSATTYPGRSIYGGVIVDAMFRKQIREALVFAQRI
jgi:hypothetical protein